MKKTNLLSIAFLLFSFVATAQSQKTEDYPLTVHVTRTAIAFEGTVPFVCLNVTVQGQKLLLESEFPAESKVGRFAVKTGDYKARILKEDRVNAAEYARHYEFLLSDGKRLRFYVIGESES